MGVLDPPSLSPAAHDRRLIGHLPRVLVHGHSGSAGGGATEVWERWGDKLATLLSTYLDSFGIGGAVACWSSSGTFPTTGVGDGGYNYVCQEHVPARFGAPYLPEPGLAIVWYGENDLATLGNVGYRPCLEAIRTMINVLRASERWTSHDAAFTRVGTWTNQPGTTRNSDVGFYHTTTPGDFQTWVVPADWDGRDLVVYCNVDDTARGAAHITLNGSNVVNGVAVPDISLDASLVCDPLGGKHNVVCQRFFVPAAAAGQTLRVTFNLTAGGAGLDGVSAQGTPARLTVVPSNWRAYNYVGIWGGWPHGPLAGVDPMTDASVLASNVKLQNLCAEWTDGSVLYVDIDTPLNKQANHFSTADGVHPNDTGQNLIAEAIYNKLRTVNAPWASVLAWQGAASPDGDTMSYDRRNRRVGIGMQPYGVNNKPRATLEVGGDPYITSLTTPTMIVKGTGGQTADAFQVRSAINDAVVVSIEAGFGVTTLAAAIVGSGTGGVGQLQTTSLVSTVPALVCKGFPTGSADLTQWRNSAGTVLARVASSGGGIFPAVVAGDATFVSAYCNVTSLVTTTVALSVRGANGQSANLQEWKQYNGTTLGAFGQSGIFTSIGAGIGTSGLTPPATLGIKHVYAGAPTVHVRGESTLTYNMTEWSAYTGTPLAQMDALGNLSLQALTPYSASQSVIVKGLASQTGDLQQWQDSAAVVRAKVLSNGTFQGYFGGLFGPAAGAPSATLGVNALNSGTVGTVVKGAASQSANLQEWQDSTGAVMANVTAAGAMTHVMVIPPSASVVPMRVVGFASQSADLQTWEDSANVVRARVTSGGVLQAYIGAAFGPAAGVPSATAAVNALNSGSIGIAVRGASGQTVSLQEWQDSTAAVLARVPAAGGFQVGPAASIPSGTVGIATLSSATVGIAVKGAASQASDFLQFISSASVTVASIGAGGALTAANVAFTTPAAGTIAAVIKAASTQTADLTQWQDSSAGVLAKISAAGKLTVPQAAVTITTAANVGLLIMQAASQSGNPFEVRDSGNALTARIDSTGVIFAQPGAATAVSIGASFGVAGIAMGASFDTLILRTAAAEITTNKVIHSASAASQVPLVSKGFASQTGNLAEFQNSSGVSGILALIDKSGNIAANAVGAGLRVKEGTNAKQGVSTLVAGTVTVANTSITATSRIQISVQALGTVAAPKAVAVTGRLVGTSFTITSADATDTSTVAWEIFEPA